MTDQSNIDPFQKTQETPEIINTLDPFADQLSAIKNESGEIKYTTTPKALEGLQHAQNYIPQLKSDLEAKDVEIAKLKADLDKRDSVEDVVSRLQKPSQPVPSATVATASGLDEQSAIKLFENLSKQQEQATAMQMNRQKVNDKLTSLYSDKAPEVIAKRASELGISTEELGELANTKPEVVLSLFNINPTATQGSTTSSINIPATNVVANELQPPSKSLLAGATAKEQAAYMEQIKLSVHQKFGVTT